MGTDGRWRSYGVFIMEKKTMTVMIVGVFIATAISANYILSQDMIDQGYRKYTCDFTEETWPCFNLSKVNKNGIQSWCYWNISAPSRYKPCKTGWYPEQIETPDITIRDALRVEGVANFEIYENGTLIGISDPTLNYSCIVNSIKDCCGDIFDNESCVYNRYFDIDAEITFIVYYDNETSQTFTKNMDNEHTTIESYTKQRVLDFIDGDTDTWKTNVARRVL